MPDVLIVEDDDAVRTAFERTLRHAGFDVVTAENGVVALLEIAKRDFDAVVCDYKMPELGGLGFYEQLEELFPPLAARVVFATAYAEDPKIRNYLDKTGQPVLSKPVETQNLVVEVQRLIARQRKAAKE